MLGLRVPSACFPGAIMGIQIMRLVIFCMVSSGEGFRLPLNSKNHDANGVQQEDKRGRVTIPATATDVCKVEDSGTTCRELGEKYRGGASAIAGAVENTSLNVIKVLLQMCLTTINVVCWLVPMKIRSFVESKRAISMANAFSGGIFLSLAFGHMLPQSVHGFEGSGLPENLPYFLTLSGYMLIFFVEKIAFDAHHIMNDGGGSHHHHGGSVSAKDEMAVVGAERVTSSGRSATILLVALGVHALMETMALGLSSSKLSAGLLAMSIGLHQPAESLALLVSFLKSGLKERQIITMLSVFSCIGPVGVGIGIAVSEFFGQLADAIMIALAAGTFIYVGATEVIAEEFETPENKWKKFLALSGGIVIIAFVTHWAETLEGRA